jgi:hypothetical protein
MFKNYNSIIIITTMNIIDDENDLFIYFLFIGSLRTGPSYLQITQMGSCYTCYLDFPAQLRIGLLILIIYMFSTLSDQIHAVYTVRSICTRKTKPVLSE